MNSKHQKCTNLDSLLALPTEAAVEFQGWRPNRAGESAVAAASAITVAPALGAAELRFLRAVVDHPGKPSSAYAKLSGLGTHQAIKARQRLAIDGYLRERRVNTHARGRASVVLEPSTKAIKVVAEEGK